MKKIICIVLFLILLINLKEKATSPIVLPEESIRYRIIANSDTPFDQETKIKVKEALEDVLNPIMLSSKTKNEMKKSLSLMMPVLNEKIETTLKTQGVEPTYQIQYGMNPFPQKKYQGITYQAGKYESLVVTIGQGKGANFWCILFPPLCLLEGENQENKKIEYTSVIQEILKSLFHSK